MGRDRKTQQSENGEVAANNADWLHGIWWAHADRARADNLPIGIVIERRIEDLRRKYRAHNLDHISDTDKRGLTPAETERLHWRSSREIYQDERVLATEILPAVLSTGRLLGW